MTDRPGLRRLISISLILGCLLGCNPVESPAASATRVVASFDIGSGSTRMLVAEVDQCSGQVIRPLDQASVKLDWSDDLLRQGNGGFSAEMIQTGVEVIGNLIDHARQWQPDQIQGVATQAFRLAGNAEEVLTALNQAGLDARIVSQAEEGQMAWTLVDQTLPIRSQPLVVWDMGAGSQQWVWQQPAGTWQHVHSDLASVTFKLRVMDTLNRPEDSHSPNPISEDERARLNGLAASWFGAQPSLRDMLASQPMVVGIGGVHGISVPRQIGIEGNDPITRHEVEATLQRQLGRSDAEIGGKYAATDVTNLILVGELMNWLGLDTYRFLAADLTRAQLLTARTDCH
ncbi:MAG: Ppx/GppA phosphatase family protein [Wenzhouxiangella sp.]